MPAPEHEHPGREAPVAIVSGSSRGIGRAIALQLAGDGYDLVVNYVRSRAGAEEVAAAVQAAGRAAVVVGADVSRADARQSLVDAALDRFGRLDVLVNNAGITSPGRRDLLDATEEAWEAVFATNLKGPFFLAQLAARAMIGLRGQRRIERGTIVNVSSISAYAASVDRADYCLAKAAMPMMTWLLAARLADEQIRVFEICPGIIASDMTAPVRDRYDQRIADGLTPIRRWGQPEDVARAVSAVVGPQLPFTTGQQIHVDGGFHIRRL